VGWDDITGSAAATATNPGVAPLTTDNACNSIKAAKKVADIVIAMPQWGWPEYHANITSDQEKQRALFYSCGADESLGAARIGPPGPQCCPAPTAPVRDRSHGNFLFDQSWSRQTMEGVVVEATFYGKKLVQSVSTRMWWFRAPSQTWSIRRTDGAYVLHQVWSSARSSRRPGWARCGDTVRRVRPVSLGAFSPMKESLVASVHRLRGRLHFVLRLVFTPRRISSIRPRARLSRPRPCRIGIHRRRDQHVRPEEGASIPLCGSFRFAHRPSSTGAGGHPAVSILRDSKR